MSESQVLSPHGVVAAAHRAIIAGDVDGFVRRFAEDAVLEFPFSLEPSLPSRVEGREAIRRVAPALRERLGRTHTRLGRFDGAPVQGATDAESIVIEVEAPAGSGATPTARRLPDIQVWRVSDGQVVSMRHYLSVQASANTSRSRESRGPVGSAWG